jgi:hypothetical protein
MGIELGVFNPLLFGAAGIWPAWAPSTTRPPRGNGKEEVGKAFLKRAWSFLVSFSKRLGLIPGAECRWISQIDCRALKNITRKPHVILCWWRNLSFILVEIDRGRGGL